MVAAISVNCRGDASNRPNKELTEFSSAAHQVLMDAADNRRSRLSLLTEQVRQMALDASSERETTDVGC
jgi:hypothetical protein